MASARIKVDPLQNPQKPIEERALVIECSRGPEILWEAPYPLQITRLPGLFLDDARIAGGKWLRDSNVTPVSSDLAISGSLRGGRFQTYFRDLLQFSG